MQRAADTSACRTADPVPEVAAPLAAGAPPATAAAAPELTAEERFLIHLVATVGAARNHGLEGRFKALGLTAPAVRALAWIKARPRTTMGELAAGVFIDRTTLSRTVDQLVAEGLVLRTADAQDRRRLRLTLTEHGEAVCADGHHLIDEASAPVAGRIDPAAVRAAIRVLLQLHEAFVDDPVVRAVHLGRPQPA